MNGVTRDKISFTGLQVFTNTLLSIGEAEDHQGPSLSPYSLRASANQVWAPFTMTRFLLQSRDDKLHNRFTISTKEQLGPLKTLHKEITKPYTRRWPPRVKKLLESHLNKSMQRAKNIQIKIKIFLNLSLSLSNLSQSNFCNGGMQEKGNNERGQYMTPRSMRYLRRPLYIGSNQTCPLGLLSSPKVPFEGFEPNI